MTDAEWEKEEARILRLIKRRTKVFKTCTGPLEEKLALNEKKKMAEEQLRWHRLNRWAS